MRLRQQVSLLTRRGFAAYFATLFSGALNDNLLRQGVLVLIAFRLAGDTGLAVEWLVSLASLLFVLPFVLLSAYSGHLADHVDKATLIRSIKLLEILIVSFASVGLYLDDLRLLMPVLFLMGAQSALFATVKYSILPELLDNDELTAGNALVESATVLAILLGSLAGGLFLHGATHWMIGALLVVAVAGWLFAQGIPHGGQPAATTSLFGNPYLLARSALRLAGTRRDLLLTMLGISWYWFIGVLLLTQMPIIASDFPNASASTYGAMLSALVVGTVIGSLICARFSGPVVEVGLVPIGSLVMSIALVVLGSLIPVYRGTLLNMLISLGVLGAASAVYVVPLYTLLQQRSERAFRSRLFGANNLLNAAMMCLGLFLSLALFLLPGSQLDLLFFLLALLNIVVTAYIFFQVPEFLLRFVAWMLLHTIYRTRSDGTSRIPHRGPALLVCNHVSFMDAVVIAGSVRRPIRFVMYHGVFKRPVLNFLFRAMKTIPIAPAKEDEGLLERAFDTVAEELERGQLVCIFPEGKLTLDGELNEFKPGAERILARTPVDVVPMALRNMWDSLFSRQTGNWLKRILETWRPVELHVGDPLPPDKVTMDVLRERVTELRGNRG